MEKIVLTYDSEIWTFSWCPCKGDDVIQVGGKQTPFTTADARHDACMAAMLVFRWLVPDGDWVKAGYRIGEPDELPSR